MLEIFNCLSNVYFSVVFLGPIIPINGMLAAVIVLCAAAISYMAWKRRKEIHDYSKLVEEIED